MINQPKEIICNILAHTYTLEDSLKTVNCIICTSKHFDYLKNLMYGFPYSENIRGKYDTIPVMGYKICNYDGSIVHCDMLLGFYSEHHGAFIYCPFKLLSTGAVLNINVTQIRGEITYFSSRSYCKVKGKELKLTGVQYLSYCSSLIAKLMKINKIDPQLDLLFVANGAFIL